MKKYLLFKGEQYENQFGTRYMHGDYDAIEDALIALKGSPTSMLFEIVEHETMAIVLEGGFDAWITQYKTYFPQAVAKIWFQKWKEGDYNAGVSVHTSRQSAKSFTLNHLVGNHNNHTDSPHDKPYEGFCDTDLYDRIVKSENGLRFFDIRTIGHHIS